MTAPIRAERVIDGDSYAVQLTFDPGTVLVSLTADKVTIDLTPREAEALTEALDEAWQAPDKCERCGNFAVLAVDFVPLCDRHSRSLDKQATR